MPHITAAMYRSVRRRPVDIVLESLLGRRSITDGVSNGVSNVKDTFSSWDNCMAQSYCKWPVIAGIVIGSLIIFSVLWCCIRCCCCGMSCCCTCFSFLKCCDCCGGACEGKKNKPTKHLDEPYGHHGGPTGGYHAPASMPIFGKPEPPRYAQFEVGKSGLAVEPPKLNEDALPPMPSWDGAAKKRVETQEEKNAVELGELDPSTGQKVPLMAGGVAAGNSMPPSPIHELGASPYGAQPRQANGYAGLNPGDSYTQDNGSFSGNGAYGGVPARGPSRGYGSPPPQESQDYQNFNGPAGSAFDRPPQLQNGSERSRQYPPQQSRQYPGNSSRPMNRQYSDRSYQSDNFNGQPPRGPSRGSPSDNFNVQPPRGPPMGPYRGPQPRVASPPMNNESGFNFSPSQDPTYSRHAPQQQPSYNSGRLPSPPMAANDDYYEGSTAPPTYASRSPPPQEQQYSGYQSYQSPQSSSSHQRAPTALRPGAGRMKSDRREPTQGWDPVNH